MDDTNKQTNELKNLTTITRPTSSSYQKSGASFYDEIDYLKAFTCTLDIVNLVCSSRIRRHWARLLYVHYHGG